ncbi:MAG: hypothetical protein OEM62_06245 [Acidobacteriota bacterium]|nr:hypothetical protein [Acidobacteriota bacterium]
MSREPQIKGFAIRGLLKFVKESSYAGGIPSLLEKLPIDAQPFFRERILSSLWYPYAAFSALARTIESEMGAGDVALLEDIGRLSGRQDLGGIFRFITAILTVERVVNRSPAFWNRYCDSGELEVVESGQGRFTVRLKDFPKIDRAHCHMITGWIRGLGEGTGVKNFESRKVRCVHSGDSWCEYQGTWS